MTKEATVEQLSIFDEIERQDVAAATADDSLDGYQTRYERGELLPGERAPGAATSSCEAATTAPAATAYTRRPLASSVPA